MPRYQIDQGPYDDRCAWMDRVLVLWKEDDAAKRLRAVIKDLGGTITELPPGTFSSEGTEVQTCVVRIG